MHLIIIHEKLLDPRHQIPLHPVMLVRIQAQSAEVTRESDVVTISAEVDIDLVVHRELVDRVNTVLNNFLHDAHSFGVEDEHKSTIKAGEEYGLISWMTSHYACIIKNILVVLAVLCQIVCQDLHGVRVEYLDFDVCWILLLIFIILRGLRFVFTHVLLFLDADGTVSVSAVP